MKDKKVNPIAERDEREKRRSEALRANLAKRKAQERERQATEK